MPRISPPILSLNTLPSMRLTLPSRFRWPADRADPDPPGLTWYQTSSSGDLTSSSAVTRSRVTKCQLVSRFSPATATSSELRPSFTFVQSLKFGAYRGNVWYQFKKPWFTLRLPATWVIMMQYGGLVGGVAVISTMGPQILAFPPYQWGPHAGLLFLGALIGIIFGGLCTALLADKRLKKSAQDQDHGYAEPESRVAVMLPALAIGTCGLLVFGLCAQYPGKYRWVGLEFAYGMVAFALAQVPSVWFSYVSRAPGIVPNIPSLADLCCSSSMHTTSWLATASS